MSSSHPFPDPAVIAQTSEWLVINKPAGWLSIPGRDPRQTAPVLSTWVEENLERSWVVHRLDRETSGVILFARTEESHRKASLWFQNHEVSKVYECIAQGVPAIPVMRIKAPVGAQSSITQVEVKERFREGFVASVRPLTGRRHQIRVHLSGQGFPLWGDVEYGGPKRIRFDSVELEVDRVALHASRLELPSGESFSAERPDDFLLWLEVLRSEGRNV